MEALDQADTKDKLRVVGDELAMRWGIEFHCDDLSV
jgi:hypothetical protein